MDISEYSKKRKIESAPKNIAYAPLSMDVRVLLDFERIEHIETAGTVATDCNRDKNLLFICTS